MGSVDGFVEANFLYMDVNPVIWIIDGSHRLAAIKSIVASEGESFLETLPCISFEMHLNLTPDQQRQAFLKQDLGLSISPGHKLMVAHKAKELTSGRQAGADLLDRLYAEGYPLDFEGSGVGISYSSVITFAARAVGEQSPIVNPENRQDWIVWAISSLFRLPLERSEKITPKELGVVLYMAGHVEVFKFLIDKVKALAAFPMSDQDAFNVLLVKVAGRRKTYLVSDHEQVAEAAARVKNFLGKAISPK